MTNLIGTSWLRSIGSDTSLALETGLNLTPGGLVSRPEFFSGVLSRPEIAAAGILTVADVATTTYLDLSALAASRDPVVTASGDRLRFESFSGCNGVYARFDLLAEGIASGEVSFGTTNVDVNMPLRGALAALPPHELMHLAVGRDVLRMSTLDQTHEERKVALPHRWARGFAEIPTILPGMDLALEANKTQAMAFLAGLPRGAPGPVVGVAPGPRGHRLTGRGARGSATLAGTSRLTSLRRVMRHIRRLTVWAHDSGASAWAADLDGGRITLALTPQPYRGFSGEGQLLLALAGAADAGQAASLDPALRVLEHLAWEPRVDPALLAAETGMSVSQVHDGIAVLAASGKVGYDLSEAAYFHRELPYDDEAVDRDHPRLRAARTIVAAGGVARTDSGFRVRSHEREHWVTLADSGASCTCRWYARYRGDRGPCSHILAARLFRDA